MIIAPMQVQLHSNPKRPDEGFAVRFPYSEADVKQIRTVLGLMWDKHSRKENYAS